MNGLNLLILAVDCIEKTSIPKAPSGYQLIYKAPINLSPLALLSKRIIYKYAFSWKMAQIVGGPPDKKSITKGITYQILLLNQQAKYLNVNLNFENYGKDWILLV